MTLHLLARLGGGCGELLRSLIDIFTNLVSFSIFHIFRYASLKMNLQVLQPKVLTSAVIFLVVLYWLKKTRGSLRRRPPVSCQPPKIVTDQYWPVKNAIMEHLELEDLLNLKNAYPSLQLQMWEKNKGGKSFYMRCKSFDVGAIVSNSIIIILCFDSYYVILSIYVLKQNSSRLTQ